MGDLIMIDIYKLVKDKCTGCGGCSNICHKNAISMKNDKDGFIIPVTDKNLCTDCKACTKICPALEFKSSNSIKPKLYAARADNEIRAQSSSGGIFTLIAENVLEKKGVVCGAAFDNKMSLNHVIIKEKFELGRLRGSKYVQSNTGLIYRAVKENLIEGRKVFFTGTPCQAAALRNYLGKSYDNLIVMDVLCHGVPSEVLFKKYLNQKFKGKNVIDVRFRDKQFGWNCEHIHIKFSDGTTYHETVKNDPYLKAFMRNLILRNSCGDCPFAEFPRPGDISVGDFWGITAIDKTQNDSKGTSILYVNSKKGEETINRISNKMQIKEFPFDTTVIKNRIHRNYPINPNRSRLFKFLENDRINFETAVNKALGRKYDIGIVSNYYAGNFGGSLTQYALYNVLEDMGYSCLMIERPADAPSKTSLETVKKIYIDVPYDSSAIAAQRKSREEMRNLNNICDMFIVGSDQLFQYNLYKMLGRFVALDWVDGHKKKIAYAASFGHDHVWGDMQGLSEMSFYMKRFDHFSVREKSGAEITKDKFSVDAEWVLDPVFLCDKKHYDTLIEKSEKKHPEHFIASYILDPSEKKAEILKFAEKKRKVKAVVFSEFSRVGEYTAPLKEFDVQDPRVEERLQLIKNCDFFVTDSFHGTCFAIIMNKPFVSIINNNRGGSRFISLLSMFGLDDRLITDLDSDSCQQLINKPIDFNKVNRILEKEKARCLSWLKNALTSEKKLDYSSYDLLINKLIAQDNEIKELKSMVSSIIAEKKQPLKFITDPVLYFNVLAKRNNDYIVIMSVKDTPGMYVSAEVTDAMTLAGFKSDIRNKHWNSYIGIMNCGIIVYEKLSTDEIVYRGKIDDMNLTVVSRNFKIGNVSKNIINGVDYSVNHRGVNITVIDKTTGIIEDSVCFDMHTKKYEHRRN